MSEENFEEIAEVAMQAIEEESGGHHKHMPNWIEWAALSTMLIALFSAAGGLLAGITGNEAIIDRQEQIGELINVNRMELASEVLLTRLAVIESAGDKPEQALLDDIRDSQKEVSEHAKKAFEDVEESKSALRTHEVFAIGTTVLSVAITLIGMAVIVRQKRIWYVGLAISTCGAGFIIYGIVMMASEA